MDNIDYDAGDDDWRRVVCWMSFFILLFLLMWWKIETFSLEFSLSRRNLKHHATRNHISQHPFKSSLKNRYKTTTSLVIILIYIKSRSLTSWVANWLIRKWLKDLKCMIWFYFIFSCSAIQLSILSEQTNDIIKVKNHEWMKRKFQNVFLVYSALLNLDDFNDNHEK